MERPRLSSVETPSPDLCVVFRARQPLAMPSSAFITPITRPRGTSLSFGSQPHSPSPSPCLGLRLPLTRVSGPAESGCTLRLLRQCNTHYSRRPLRCDGRKPLDVPRHYMPLPACSLALSMAAPPPTTGLGIHRYETS